MMLQVAQLVRVALERVDLQFGLEKDQQLSQTVHLVLARVWGIDRGSMWKSGRWVEATTTCRQCVLTSTSFMVARQRTGSTSTTTTRIDIWNGKVFIRECHDGREQFRNALRK